MLRRIKLTTREKMSYIQQIDNLKDEVSQAINDMDFSKVTRVKRAGSWKKGTALAPKGDYPLDVDMVFFLDIKESIAFDAEELRDEIIKVLCKAYPKKTRADFTNGKKTVGVVFRGSGLEVDIVPFIPEKGNTTYGRQPRKKLSSGEFKTSIDKQLNFIDKIKNKYHNFTSLVRILKSWRNYKELELSSFSIELIVAHLIEEGRISDTSINLALIYFFNFLVRDDKDDPIKVYFSDAIGKRSNESPWIADPTNNENNTINMSDSEWNEVLEMAEEAFETLSFAEAKREIGETLDEWKKIFGSNFNIQE